MRTSAITSLSLALLSTSCASAPAPTASVDDRTWQTGVVALVGGRSLDEDQWAPVEDHLVLGLQVDTRPADFPLGIEFGAEASFGREFDIRLLGQDFDLASTVTELYVGPRLTIDSGERGGFVPYVAGGITWLDGELEAIQGSVVVSDSDDTVAGYVHGGFYYLFDSNMRVGVDARAVFGSDLSLFGADVDADYGQVAITIGGEF